MADISIKEDNFIVDRGGTVYSGELSRRFKPPFSFHISRRYVVVYLVEWDVEVYILVLLLCLV